MTEAARAFIEAGQNVTVLTPEDGWVAPRCREAGADIVAYDYDAVISEATEHRDIWARALSDAHVAICTVHPPREGFHCSCFAARVIRENHLDVCLMPKTGTIVPAYLRDFYMPDDTINCHVIAITDFTRRYLVETYRIPEERIELIYQGTEIDLFTPDAGRNIEAAKRYPLPENAGPVLGYAGSFEERKGLPVLLKATAALVKPFPDIHLVLVGDGPDEAMLKTLAADLGIEGHVSFFPFTSEPVYVFERIDITVLTSLTKEGLPNILLEAMSMGLPVVASRLAGIPEIVKPGETGELVPPGEVDAVVQGVTRLWSDPEGYRRMADNARRLMEERFDKRRQFTAFLDFFRSIGHH